MFLYLGLVKRKLLNLPLSFAVFTHPATGLHPVLELEYEEKLAH